MNKLTKLALITLTVTVTAMVAQIDRPNSNTPANPIVKWESQGAQGRTQKSSDGPGAGGGYIAHEGPGAGGGYTRGRCG